MAIAINWKLWNAINDGDFEVFKEQIHLGADTNQRDKEEHTLLMHAAAHKCVDIVRFLVENVHMPIDICEQRGWTALMVAASHGNAEVVKYLVSAGANLHAKSAYEETVLHIAARAESVETFSFLQQSGADLEAQDMLDRTVLHNAADFAYPEMVQFILQGGWFHVDCKDKFGQTPLMLTAGFPRNEKQRVIREHWLDHCDDYLNKAMVFLLDAGADPSIKDVLGRTAVHRALINKRNYIYLMERCPNFIHLIDRKRQTPVITGLSLYSFHYDISNTVKLLLAAGTNPNIQDEDGRTALQLASERHCYEVIKALFQARVRTSNCGKETLTQILHYAAWTEKYEIVQQMLKDGADINGRKVHAFISYEVEDDHRCMKNYNPDIFKFSELTGETPIFNALSSKMMTSLLISAGADVNFKDKYHFTPLLAAFDGGSCEVMEKLLDAGADPNAANICGVTLLHCMPKLLSERQVIDGFLKLCERVISSGATVDATDHDGRTPLHYAAVAKSWKKTSAVLPFIELLVKAGSRVNAADVNNQSPLHYAARTGNLECMEKLIAVGAELNAVEIYNVIPDNVPSLFSYLEILEVLAKHGADLLARDKNGRTALHQAAQIADHFAINYLLDLYKVEWGLDNQGNSILHAASGIGENSQECMKLILQKNVASVNDKNGKGQTALSIVVQDVPFFNSSKCAAEILLNAGANPNIVDNEGRTALHYAVISVDIEAVEFLIAHRGDITIRDTKGELPLHCAAKIGCLHLLDLLLRIGNEKTLTVDEKDSDGQTALMHAVDCRDAVNFLLREGADVNAKDNNGKTALQSAIECRNFHSAKLLWTSGGNFSSLPQVSLIKAAHLAVEGNDLQMFEHLISLGLTLSDCWWDYEHKNTLLHRAAISSLESLKYFSNMAQSTEELNDNGLTALLCAVYSANVVGTKYLIQEAKAQVDARDARGRTALMSVVERSDEFPEMVEIFHILLQAGADWSAQDKTGENVYEIAYKSKYIYYCNFLDYWKYCSLSMNSTWKIVL